ncbi:MAG TPA: hypothetical protein PLU22_12445 [Polyangiaceae bacterium]|nr:hypothetical protein [Polyangiaceae bacterium]
MAPRESQRPRGDRAARPHRARRDDRRPDPAGRRRPTRDAQGRDRPAFVLDFPSDPALDPLVAAFERGDFRWVRREAPRVARDAASPAVRRAALELRRRIDPDPVAVALLGIAVALLAFLVVWTYAIPHAH